MAIGDELKAVEGESVDTREAILTSTEKARMENADKAMKSFSRNETVNGIEISVGWNDGYRGYTIYFPDIVIGDEGREKGVADQVIRIDTNPETAALVADYARKIAKGEPDVYKVYKRVETFTREVSE